MTKTARQAECLVGRTSRSAADVHVGLLLRGKSRFQSVKQRDVDVPRRSGDLPHHLRIGRREASR